MVENEQITSGTENKSSLSKILSFAKEAIILVCATFASSIVSITISKTLPKIGAHYFGQGWLLRYDSLLYAIDLFVLVPLAIFGGTIIVYFFRWRHVWKHEKQNLESMGAKRPSGNQDHTCSDTKDTHDDGPAYDSPEYWDTVADVLLGDKPYREEVDDELNWDTDDPYLILNLPRTATVSEIKSAYHALIIQYHPDKYSSSPPDFQKLADERSKKINWAYSECLKRAA